MIKYRNIEAERARLGLSKKAIAGKIGITVMSYWNKVISGRTQLKIDEINKLREITGRTSDYLLETAKEDDRHEDGNDV